MEMPKHARAQGMVALSVKREPRVESCTLADGAPTATATAEEVRSMPDLLYSSALTPRPPPCPMLTPPPLTQTRT